MCRDLKSPNLLVDAGWRVKVRSCTGREQPGKGLAHARRSIHTPSVPLPAHLTAPWPLTLLPPLQLCDFNLSSLLDATRSHSSSLGGGMLNPRWLAPEVLAGGAASAASDTFSYAVVMVRAWMGCLCVQGEGEAGGVACRGGKGGGGGEGTLRARWPLNSLPPPTRPGLQWELLTWRTPWEREGKNPFQVGTRGRGQRRLQGSGSLAAVSWGASGGWLAPSPPHSALPPPFH